MEWIVGLVAIIYVLLIVPEILIIPLILMEFILRLFGKSFNDF